MASKLKDCIRDMGYQIVVLASMRQLARIRNYLRRHVEKVDPLDIEAYKERIQRLYDKWPISEEMLSTGRIKKKNAGEVSIKSTKQCFV